MDKKKKVIIISIIILIILLLLIFFLTRGKGKYNVTVVGDGGSIIEIIELKKGSTIKDIKIPKIEGKEFLYWEVNGVKVDIVKSYSNRPPPPFCGLWSSICSFMRSQLPQPVYLWKSHCS